MSHHFWSLHRSFQSCSRVNFLLWLLKRISWASLRTSFSFWSLLLSLVAASYAPQNLLTRSLILCQHNCSDWPPCVHCLQSSELPQSMQQFFSRKHQIFAHSLQQDIFSCLTTSWWALHHMLASTSFILYALQEVLHQSLKLHFVECQIEELVKKIVRHYLILNQRQYLVDY